MVKYLLRIKIWANKVSWIALVFLFIPYNWFVNSFPSLAHITYVEIKETLIVARFTVLNLVREMILFL